MNKKNIYTLFFGKKILINHHHYQKYIQFANSIRLYIFTTIYLTPYYDLIRKMYWNDHALWPIIIIITRRNKHFALYLLFRCIYDNDINNNNKSIIWQWPMYVCFHPYWSNDKKMTINVGLVSLDSFPEFISVKFLALIDWIRIELYPKKIYIRSLISIAVFFFFKSFSSSNELITKNQTQTKKTTTLLLLLCNSTGGTKQKRNSLFFC